MVLPCAQGNEAMCRLVEDMLGKKPKKGSRKWYLEQAYREIVRGDLSPKGFSKSIPWNCKGFKNTIRREN